MDGPTSPPSARSRRRLGYLLSGATLVVLGAAVSLAWPWLTAFTDPERARRIVIDSGAWGPLVFIGMQTVQVVLAPIPGQVTGLAGGYLFGPWLGAAYALAGATLGFLIVLLLVRRFGRPFVDRFASPGLVGRFDHLAGSRGVLVLFLVFLLPALPDDVISLAAGLTRIRIRTLLLVSLAGRAPGYVALGLLGDGLALENVGGLVAGGIAVAAVGAVALWKRAWLLEMARSGDVVGFVRKRWALSPPATVALALGVVLAVIGLVALARFL